MATSRIDIFKQMLVNDPINSSILFGLAKEYEKTGQTAEMIETLEQYLATSDDEGNAFGMLARERDVSVGSGVSLEEIVTQLMKPLLSAWLDEHLPEIVERVVQQEVERAARSGGGGRRR